MFEQAESTIAANVKAIDLMAGHMDAMRERITALENTSSSSPCVDIRKQGAKPLATHPDFDNGPLLQRLFDGVASGDIIDPIYIPGTAWGIKTSLRIPPRATGLRIQCNGRSQLHDDERFWGQASRLVWTGDHKCDAMLTIESVGACIDGLMLIGRHQGGARAYVGLLQQKGSGIGTGKMWCPQLTVADCECGIWIKGPNNCDMNTFESLVVDTCDVGYRQSSVQTVSNRIGHVWSRNTPTVLQIEGGRIAVDGADVTPDVETFARFENRDGGLLHSFSNIQMDHGSKAVLIEAWPMSRPAIIEVSKLRMNKGLGHPVIRLKDHVLCVLEKSSYLRDGMFDIRGHSTHKPVLRVNDCKMAKNVYPKDLIHEDSKRHYTMSWDRCCEYDGDVIEDGSHTVN